jgi:hypothetical protein
MHRPVTQTLIEQLRRAFLSNPLVIWLDKAGQFTQFVDELGSDGPERIGGQVLAYRGSYLELMRQLARTNDGVDPSRLLVHVPGANQDSIKTTPLLELNETGHQFRKALDTLIREAAAGRVTPDEVDGYLRDAGEGVSLDSADAWMAQRVAVADGSTQALLRGTDPGRLIHDLVSKGPLARELGFDQLHAVWHYLATQTGLADDWPTAERRKWAQDPLRDRSHEPGWDPEQAASEGKRRLADLAGAWVLCVEYVHDLERAPKAAMLEPAKAQARPLIEACRAAARYLREHARKYYVSLADDVEDQIVIERKEGDADELGRIDTFRFEEDRLLEAALEAVRERAWAQVSSWAAERLAGESVWIEIDPARRKTWELIATAAELGTAIDGSSLSFTDARNIDEATMLYADHGAVIDGLHRAFEQQAARDLGGDALPHIEKVRAAVEATQGRWRTWAERGAQQWNKLCEDEGVLPGASLQQRNLFEQVVAPLLDDREHTALFLVDAMRYEMGQQLLAMIGQQAASSVRLSPRLAELPSVTEVGMNVLAAAGKAGRLHPLLDGKRRRMQGFDADGFQVKSRLNRETSLGRASGGVKWLEIEQLFVSDASIARQIAKSRLVVVHSIQIDKTGTAGSGLLEFPGELRRIYMAWQQLRAAGVRRFVFTSDHGFLLRRGDEDDEIQHGQHYDALHRYALYPAAISNEHQIGFSMRKLGYEGADEAVVVPRGLGIYPSGRGLKFVHGGNSPQERVIPVLTIEHRQAVGGEDQRYRVEMSNEVGGSTSHELSGCVIRADNQTTLALDVEPVEIELRAADGVGVVTEVLECEGAMLVSGLIAARVGEPFRLRFRLSSVEEQRVRVELFGASAKRRVDAATSQARFASLTPGVSGAFRIVDEVTAAPTAELVKAEVTKVLAGATAWFNALPDPGVRKVMEHLTEHGEVTEADLYRLLGHDRKVRQFARKFEEYRAPAPFLIELSAGPKGKVYRKVTDK